MNNTNQQIEEAENHYIHKQIKSHFKDVEISVKNDRFIYKIGELDYELNLVIDFMNEDAEVYLQLIMMNIIQQLLLNHSFNYKQFSIYYLSNNSNCIYVDLINELEFNYKSEKQYEIEGQTFTVKSELMSEHDDEVFERKSLNMLSIKLDQFEFEQIENNIKKLSKIKNELLKLLI